MTTAGKIAVGAAVVIGGIVVYKMIAPTPKPPTTSLNTSSSAIAGAGGFINSIVSAVGYFGHQQRQPQMVPSVSPVSDSTFTADDINAINDFRTTDYSGMTDAQRDAAILG